MVDAIAQLVLKRVAEDGVPVPMMPSSVATCLFLTKNAEFDLAEVCRAIESEPMMAAALLKRANSAEQAPSTPITTLKAASSRLGTKGVRSLIVELAAEKIYVSRDKAIMAQAAKIWQHCLAVAAAAREVANALQLPNVDDIYLAGLLHDIGKPLIAGMLLAAEKQIVEANSGKWITSEQWSSVVETAHRKLGVALAMKWELPPRVVAAISESAIFEKEEPRAAANVICFANALAKLNGAATDSYVEDAQQLVAEGQSLLGIEPSMLDAAKAAIAEQMGNVQLS